MLKVGGHLKLSRNWRVCLQLKAKSVKEKGRGGNRWREESAKWYDYLYLSNSMIRNAGIGLSQHVSFQPELLLVIIAVYFFGIWVRCCRTMNIR